MSSYNMTPLPELQTGTSLEQLSANMKTIKNWLFQLNEQLRYNLLHIGEENLSQELVNKMTSVSDSVKAELSVLDGKITAAVSDADGRFSALQVSINGIAAQVGDAEGNISALQQTATSLTASVNSLNGDMAAVELQAGKISWIVASGTSASNFTLTNRMASLVAEEVEIATDNLKVSSLSYGNYTQLYVNNSGVYLEPAVGTVYLGNGVGYVYCRNVLSTPKVEISGTHDANAIKIATGNIVGYDTILDVYRGVFSGTVEASSFDQSSDERLKDSVEDLDEAVYEQLISGLRPVQYKYINAKDRKLRFGFIAQEVKAALESVGISECGLVTQAPESEMYGLSYTDLIAPLVMVVQKLKRELDAVKEAIT